MFLHLFIELFHKDLPHSSEYLYALVFICMSFCLNWESNTEATLVYEYSCRRYKTEAECAIVVILMHVKDTTVYIIFFSKVIPPHYLVTENNYMFVVSIVRV